MIVYQCNHAGYFVCTTQADPSPREPGVYLIPAGAVTTAPPEVPDGKWPRWNGGAWTLVNKPEPVEQESIRPEEKLRKFLEANPDVRELVG